jgi:hypothetical protein
MDIDNNKKSDLKNLGTSLLSLHSNIRRVSVGLLHLKIVIAMVNMAMVGQFLPNLRKILQDNNLP